MPGWSEAGPGHCGQTAGPTGREEGGTGSLEGSQRREGGRAAVGDQQAEAAGAEGQGRAGEGSGAGKGGGVCPALPHNPYPSCQTLLFSLKYLKASRFMRLSVALYIRPFFSVVDSRKDGSGPQQQPGAPRSKQSSPREACPHGTAHKPSSEH